MFILPFPKSPGEHGAGDHSAGMVSRARRSFSLNIHMGVKGFIACALVIQAVSIAGIIPAQVWLREPSYALIVCFGLVVLSACILFSLKSLLTQSALQQPEAPANPAPVAEEGRRTEEPKAAEPRRGAPRALVVQPSRTTQRIIEKSLARCGIRCVCVDDGASATEATLAVESFDLVVADVPQPGSDQASALGGLRELCRAKGIPILALTAATESDPRQLAADAILTTPISPRDLMRIAQKLIAPPGVNADAGRAEEPATSQRELPKLELDPLDSRALGDLEKLGGPDFVRDIVAQFVADAAAVLASLSAAVSTRDTRAFREQAHALRSCAANVGAQNVYRMCLAWRDLDAQEIAASGSQYMQMLEAEFDRVRGALTPMLQGDDGPAPDSRAA